MNAKEARPRKASRDDEASSFFLSHPASDCRAPSAVSGSEGRTRGAGESRGDGRGGMLGADLFDVLSLGS